MIYHSKINNKIDINIYKTNDFKINYLSVGFVDDSNKYNSATYKVLSYLLSVSNKKYTKEQLSLIHDKHYGSKVVFSFSYLNNVVLFNASINYINASFASNLMETNIKLMFDLLNNPKMKDGLFIEEYFNEAKEILIHKKIESISDKIGLGISRYYEIVEKETKVKSSNYSVEDLVNVTNEEVSKCYFDIIKKHVFISGCGNFDIKKLKDLFKDKFSDNQFGFNFIKNIEIEKDHIEPVIEYTTNTNQAVVIKTFKCEKFEGYNPVELRLFSDVIGSSSGRLFNIVREENGLCYVIQGQPNLYTLTILVFLTCLKEDVEQALKLIEEVIDEIKVSGVNEKEVKREINYGIAEYDSFIDSGSSILSSLNIFYLRGQKFDLNASKKKLKSATIEGINKTSKHISSFFTYQLINKD